jgi:hypothetical protein
MRATEPLHVRLELAAHALSQRATVEDHEGVIAGLLREAAASERDHYLDDLSVHGVDFSSEPVRVRCQSLDRELRTLRARMHSS